MRTIFFCLLTLYGIFPQGIGISFIGNTNNSSGLLIRNKRIIDKKFHRNVPVKLRQIPYIVSIQENGFNTCSGAILSAIYIITAAHCVLNSKRVYSILSGSSFRNEGIHHYIRRKIIHPRFNINNFPNDVALLIIYPPIDLKYSPNREISLYNGFIPPNFPATFSGWGCIGIIENIRIFPHELRAITFPVISEQDCHYAYRHLTDITVREICTLDRTGQTGICFSDSGGPLVVNSRLAGILSWTQNPADARYPDVYANLSRPEYRDWITSIVHQVVM